MRRARRPGPGERREQDECDPPDGQGTAGRSERIGDLASRSSLLGAFGTRGLTNRESIARRYRADVIDPRESDLATGEGEEAVRCGGVGRCRPLGIKHPGRP